MKSADKAVAKSRSEEGSSYVIALLALFVLTILGLALVVLTQNEVQIGANERTINRVFYAAEAGAAVLEACDRAMIFGGTATVDRYRGNPKVQAHGPGFSKILLGDDVVDRVVGPPLEARCRGDRQVTPG